MKHYSIRIHHYTLFIALLIFVLGFLFRQTLDLNIGDTYYVLTSSDLSIAAAALLAIEGLIYFFFYIKRLKILPLLAAIHILCYATGFVLLNDYDLFQSREVLYEISNFPEDHWWHQLILILISQIAFLINLVVAIVRKR